MSSTPRLSIRDLARQLKVSHVTVSMALRDHPRISPQRREQVRALAEKLGYRPDPMLSSLVAYRQQKHAKPIAATLAWINRWPDPRQLRRFKEFDAYWEGALAAADRLGYRLEEFVITPELSAARLDTILSARGVRGVLIPPHPAKVSWKNFGLSWENYAVVRFGFSVVDLRAHLIGNDQMRSAELAVQAMYARNYRRIGFVTCEGFDRTTDGNFRVGYLRGCESNADAAKIEPLTLPAAASTDRLTIDKVRKWIARWKPDSVLTSEPQLPAVLKSVGLRVPEDIALAATTVRDSGSIDAGLDQNPHEIGRVAVTTLSELINHHETGMPQFCRRVLVESIWVNGNSLPEKLSVKPGAEHSGKSSTRRTPKHSRRK
jgi:LacI family transcriptional regulator